MGEEGEIVPCTNTNEDTELVMDTPKRSKNTQIATSIAKFEESPVFNFLNNLSPIKPVKSMHISQTINPLSFTTLPAVFASPHVTSLRESRFLRRNQLSDPSKPEFSTDDGTTVDKGSETTRQLDEHKENQDPKANNVENFSKNGVEFRESLNYGCNSPKSSLRSSSCLTSQHRADYACSSSRFVPFREEGTQRGIYVSESNQERITQFDSNKDSCDWESLISDASDLLVFESPNDYKKPIDPGTGLCEQHDMQNNVDAFAPGEQIIGEGSETENVSTQPGDGSEMMENFETNDMVDGSLSTNPSEKMDSENLSGLYRGMRRRCLVFDMSGAKRKHFDDNGGSVSTQDEELVCDKTGKDYSLGCVLPGIGLHLNALATTPKDYKIVNHEASASGRLLISPTPSSSVKIQPQTTNQDFSNNNMAMVAFSEAELDTFENHVPPMEDQISGYAANEEEINQSGSPKKKKRRLEQGVEGESSCKRCNCKKSKCLKLYCECFAAGVYCVEPCAVLIVLTSLFMKKLFSRHANKLNRETLLLLLPKSRGPLILYQKLGMTRAKHLHLLDINEDATAKNPVA